MVWAHSLSGEEHSLGIDARTLYRCCTGGLRGALISVYVPGEVIKQSTAQHFVSNCVDVFHGIALAYVMRDAR